MSRIANTWFSKMTQQSFRMEIPRIQVVAKSKVSNGVSKKPPTKGGTPKGFVVGESLVGGEDVTQ